MRELSCAGVVGSAGCCATRGAVQRKIVNDAARARPFTRLRMLQSMPRCMFVLSTLSSFVVVLRFFHQASFSQRRCLGNRLNAFYGPDAVAAMFRIKLRELRA